MRLLIIEDHLLFRKGMAYMLRALDKDLILEEASSIAEATPILTSGSFDLILLDLKLRDYQGLDALATTRNLNKGAPIVVISAEDSPDSIRTMIENGAMGYIPKSSSFEVMIQAIKLVLADGVYLPPEMMHTSNTANAPQETLPPPNPGSIKLDGLTPRQMTILKRVIRGLSNKQIAQDLNLSDATVKAHLTAAYRTLGVSSRTEAIFAAAQMGLRIS